MARRIVAVPAPIKLAPMPCPFVHKGPGRHRCEECRSKISGAAIREYHADCNGDTRCELGVHVPRLCERCVSDRLYAPDYDTRDMEAK